MSKYRKRNAFTEDWRDPRVFTTKRCFPNLLELFPEIRQDASRYDDTSTSARYGSLEQDSHPSALITRLREKHIMLQFNVPLEDRVKELHIISTEDRCQRQKNFCLGETVQSLVRAIQITESTHLMPIHCLEPFEKETRYLSKERPPSGWSAQRSGMNE